MFNTKRINAKWKLTIINFNNLKNEKGNTSILFRNMTF